MGGVCLCECVRARASCVASNADAPCFVGLSLAPVVVNVCAREASVEPAVVGSGARCQHSQPLQLLLLLLLQRQKMGQLER